MPPKRAKGFNSHAEKSQPRAETVIEPVVAKEPPIVAPAALEKTQQPSAVATDLVPWEREVFISTVPSLEEARLDEQLAEPAPKLSPRLTPFQEEPPLFKLNLKLPYLQYLTVYLLHIGYQLYDQSYVPKLDPDLRRTKLAIAYDFVQKANTMDVPDLEWYLTELQKLNSSSMTEAVRASNKSQAGLGEFGAFFSNLVVQIFGFIRGNARENFLQSLLDKTAEEVQQHPLFLMIDYLCRIYLFPHELLSHESSVVYKTLNRMLGDNGEKFELKKQAILKIIEHNLQAKEHPAPAEWWFEQINRALHELNQINNEIEASHSTVVQSTFKVMGGAVSAIASVFWKKPQKEQLQEEQTLAGYKLPSLKEVIEQTKIALDQIEPAVIVQAQEACRI
ncbi:MAG: hypothetical protein K0S08_433 [Gammaproteobacteria bacterium]|jgi:hypothetical protein|nr:hypothetical protein [Gammaproteobacteria bacterium]